MGLLRANTPFDVPLGSSYPPGLVGVNLGQPQNCQAPSLYLLVKPLSPRWLVGIDDGYTCSLSSHRHLLAGMAWSDSQRTRFSSRFTD